jgi:hypothetical protein
MLRLQYILNLEAAEVQTPILRRIAAVLELLEPLAEPLLAKLNEQRGARGRDDNPNRMLWRCLVAFACLGVGTVTEGLRYLELSPPLCALCGIGGPMKLPDKHACYRFERRLAQQLDLLEEMFAHLVRLLAEVLPGFGERLAADSTKVHSLANGHKPAADEDASWKKYEHQYQDETGQPRKSVVKWFGYKLHLLVDALYELPIAALLTTAKDNDGPHFPALWRKAKHILPDLPERAQSCAQDKGYDEDETHQTLWADRVAPIIPLRNQTQEENKVLLPESQQLCPRGDQLRCDGYESARHALRYDVPKTCPKRNGAGYCEFANGCRQKLIRVKLSPDNLRHLGPVPRDTPQWRRLYHGRTAVERVNSRAKQHGGLDCIRRRGQKRVSVWAWLALLAMNAFALTMAQVGRLDEVRKTVYSVAG